MTAVQVETWDDCEGEMSMEEGHGPSWEAFINHLAEDSFEGKSLLDFGCNRGGFLRALYKRKPFAKALGVDIALDSVQDAEARKGNIPAEYKHNDALADYKGAFDFAFSHEVVYLIPDLKAHAKEIYDSLKPGGVYYVAIGEYTDNPLWERWYKTVSEFSPVPPQNYSLQDMAEAFGESGFDVSVRRMVCDGFLPYDYTDKKYLLSPMELVQFMTEYMMLFRLEKRA